MKLKKAACFTDIHFGRKSNSQQHNQDCVNFITWFCEYVQSHPDIDHVVFLGDWHESRNALNIVTLKHSYTAAKKLNSLGLPIFFVVGNHDLYFKNSREVYSVIPFHEFSNFQVIDEPTVVKHTYQPTLLCPYMFTEEYKQLSKYRSTPIWMGHFEFKGFVVTGQTVRMPVGPDPTNFTTPKFIFSGHFHKRQADRNIVYIGNTFPMDFSDANDIDRGLMVFDYETEETIFENWGDCPKYIRTTLSDIIDGNSKLPSNARVQCITDETLSYQESTTLKKDFTHKFGLRDFTFHEASTEQALTDTDAEIMLNETDLMDVDHMVLQMLDKINDKQIDNEMLQNIYKQITLPQVVHSD